MALDYPQLLKILDSGRGTVATADEIPVEERIFQLLQHLGSFGTVPCNELRERRLLLLLTGLPLLCLVEFDHRIEFAWTYMG